MDLNSEKNEIRQKLAPKSIVSQFLLNDLEWRKYFKISMLILAKRLYVVTVIYSTIFSILKHCAYGRRYIAVYIIDSYNLWCLVWKTNASGSVFSKKLITSWFGCIYSGKFGRLSHSFAWWMDIFQSLKLYKCQIESKKY